MKKIALSILIISSNAQSFLDDPGSGMATGALIGAAAGRGKGSAILGGMAVGGVIGGINSSARNRDRDYYYRDNRDTRNYRYNSRNASRRDLQQQIDELVQENDELRRENYELMRQLNQRRTR